MICYNQGAQCETVLIGDRQEETQKITEVVKPFDWSYTTDYKGTVSPSGPQLEKTDKPIPLDLLRRPDPILLFDEIVLYEDEMADNGITMFSCKIRVMPDRLLLLCRFFMRLDNVIFRIRDTRVFVEFGTGEIIREYVAKEEDYEKVRLVSDPEIRPQVSSSERRRLEWAARARSRSHLL